MSNLILPRPVVTEDTKIIKDDDQLAMDTNHHLKRALDVACPQGYFPVGVGAFLMYKSKVVNDDYAFVCATPIGGASEGMCDIGWKRLRSALMRTFGRSEPRRVK